MEDKIIITAIKTFCLMCLIILLFPIWENIINELSKQENIETIPLYSVVSSNEYEYEGLMSKNIFKICHSIYETKKIKKGE